MDFYDLGRMLQFSTMNLSYFDSATSSRNSASNSGMQPATASSFAQASYARFSDVEPCPSTSREDNHYFQRIPNNSEGRVLFRVEEDTSITNPLVTSLKRFITCQCTENEMCAKCSIVKKNYLLKVFRCSTSNTPPAELERIQPPHPELAAGRRLVTCSIHEKCGIRFCKTCNKKFCKFCDSSHIEHVRCTVSVIMDETLSHSIQFFKDVDNAMRTLLKQKEYLGRVSRNVDISSEKGAREVITFFNRIIENENGRKMSLLNNIIKYKTDSLQTIISKKQMLARQIDKLRKTSEKVQVMLRLSRVSQQPIHLMVANELAYAELLLVRTYNKRSNKFWSNPFKFGLENYKILELMCKLRNTFNTRGGRQAPIPPAPFFPEPLDIPVGKAIAGLDNVIVNPKYANKRYSMPEMVLGKNESDEFCRPWGVACNKYGHIFITDRSNNRIKIYSENGILINTFGSAGQLPGEFNRPAGITIDKHERIIVADKDNHRIQIFTMQGLFLQKFGSMGKRNGEFEYPWDVATNTRCQIVVTDSRNYRIQLFSADGIFLRWFQTNKYLVGKNLDLPRGVAFDYKGNVLITDFNNHRILKISSDFDNFTVFRLGSGYELKRPQALVTDDAGNIIVTDSRNYKVAIFNKDGKLKAFFGRQGSSDWEMDRPCGVALTPKGDIVFVDFGNNRVVKA